MVFQKRLVLRSFNQVKQHIFSNYSTKLSSSLLTRKIEENNNIKEFSKPHYEQNSLNFKHLKQKYKELKKKALAGGGEKGIKRHVERNKKVLVRDRIKHILDKDLPTLEIGTFAGFGMPYGDVPCAGMVGIIGKVHGLWCLISGNDASVKSGSIYPITLIKQLRCQDIGRDNCLPTIYLVDSGGAFLPLQADIFNLGGRTFYNEAVNGANGVAQIALVSGSCTAGGAYVPAMADEAVIVDKIGTIFLGGPPLVRAATGERVTPEELGGATLHCNVSGLTDHFAATEQDGFEMIRDIVLTLNLLPDFDLVPYPSVNSFGDIDNENLINYVSTSTENFIDVRGVLKHITDGSKFHEFKKNYGVTLICGFAFINGHLTGIVSNNGRLSDKAAIKGSHFVQMCDDRQVPIIFLQNQTFDDTEFNEFDSNSDMMLKSRAKLMQSVATASVPKIVLSIGGLVGSPHNHSLCSLAFGARFHFAWPNVHFAPMHKSSMWDNLTEEYNIENDDIEKMWESTEAFHGASRLLCDEIILPQNSKSVLTICLEVFRQEKLIRLKRSLNSKPAQTLYRM